MLTSIGVPTPELLSPVSAPDDAQNPVHANAVHPDGVEPLWEQVAVLVAERKRNRFEIGKILDELHGRYARHGNGTYTARAAAICGSRSTATRWRTQYRQEAGLAPAPETFDEAVEIPFDPREVTFPAQAGPNIAGPVPGDPTPEENPEPTVCSVRVTLSLKEKKEWDANLAKLVRYFTAVQMTREDGRVIDNQHDAAFFAIWSVAVHPAVQKWEAQHEKN
jgi:hypothetical protein